MSNKTILLWILLFCAGVVDAQNNKMLGIEDVIAGGKNYSQFRPQYKNYGFIANTEALTLNSNDSVFKVDGDIKELLCSVSEVNKALKSIAVETKGLWSVKWLNPNVIYQKVAKGIYAYNIVDKKVEFFIALDENVDTYEFSPIAKSVAYVLNGDLYVANAQNEHTLVVKAGTENRVIGQAVHRNEFGITKGLFWTEDGTKLAFYDMDESMVTDYPLVDVTQRVATERDIKYPMAGMKSHEVKVGIYDVASKSTVYLKTGEPKEKYLTNLSWTPDNSSILVAELNRGQNHMQLKKYSALTGEFESKLFEETGEQWVEPEHPALFYSKDKFIWQSERDGYNHLYLYSLSGKLIKQLTKGEWVVTDVKGTDAKNKYVYFESTKDGELDRHLYRVGLSSAKVEKLSGVSAYHYFDMSASKKYAIDMYSNMTTPRVISLLNTQNKTSKQLFAASNPFEEYNIGQIKLEKIKSADGETDLNARVILPPNFDPNKKYPVVVYVYGGPHAQLVTNSWTGGARPWQLYMAQKGYIAFTMDNRGTPYRGEKFEKVIHRQLGECEAADQFEGIKYLKSLPYVDADRIGVHGWSFGGFMTINLMEKYPETFKVGVSGGPVTDWKYYEVMYGERYMDTPEENPEGYATSNLTTRVSNLKGRLLIIHGAIDPTVVWQHSLVLIEECIKNRVQVDYFVYPTHEHNVLGPDRVHLMQKVTQYFDDFL